MHYSSGKFIREGISTQNPEYYGRTVGYLKPVFYKQFMVLKSAFYFHNDFQKFLNEKKN